MSPKTKIKSNPQKTQTVTFIVQAKNVTMSPRKLRLMSRAIASLKPAEALNRLQVLNQKKANIFAPLLKNALATATHNYHIIPSTLAFSSLEVNEAPKLKRQDKSHGSRFARGIIQRRRSHLKLTFTGITENGPKS